MEDTPTYGVSYIAAAAAESASLDAAVQAATTRLHGLSAGAGLPNLTLLVSCHQDAGLGRFGTYSVIAKETSMGTPVVQVSASSTLSALETAFTVALEQHVAQVADYANCGQL